MTPTLTMTTLEAIAHLHGTLPAKPELYDDSEDTAALVALGPLVGEPAPPVAKPSITLGELADAIDKAGLRLVTPNAWTPEAAHRVTAQLNQRLAERS